MSRVLPIALACASCAAAAPAARPDVGVHLVTRIAYVGGTIRGQGPERMPLYLVPEAAARRPYSCMGGRAFCTPQTKRRPGPPYVYLGRSRSTFAVRVPRVATGPYRVVVWCQRCGGSLIMAGMTFDGEVVWVRRRPPGAVRVVNAAPRRIEHCQRAVELRGACPTRVPGVGAPFHTHLTRDLLGRYGKLTVFNMEHGGENPRNPEANRPPAMAHIVVAAGAVRRLAPIWALGTRRGTFTDGLVWRRRAHLVRFGAVRWAGRKGWLELAPPHARGGMLGNHLIFRWGRRGDEKLVSLHAWEPLSETVAVLRRVVESTR